MKPRPKAAMPEERAPQAAATAPERPPRDRVDRPGSDNPRPEPIPGQVMQEFRGADADGDGFLSRDEVRRFPFVSREFDRVDADGDGRVSLQEFARLRRLQAPQQPQNQIR